MAPERESQHYLLLVAVEEESSATNVGSACRSIFDAVLRQTTQQPAKLDIAVQLRQSAAGLRPYERCERVLAELWRRWVVACAEAGVDGPDVAIVFVETAASQDQSVDEQRLVSIATKGPVLPLQTLAAAQRPWSRVYVSEDGASDGLLRMFLETRRAAGSDDDEQRPELVVHRVPGGSAEAGSQQPQQPPPASTQRHLSVAVGGTFDHLHAGHKLLLTATALALSPPAHSPNHPRSLTIGITGDELLKNKKFAAHLESWQDRQASVYAFLSTIINFDTRQHPHVQHLHEPGPNGRATHYAYDDGLEIKCVELSDPFGPTITDPHISALVISAETREGANAVNERRVHKGWQALEVFEVAVLDASVPSQAGGQSSAIATQSAFDASQAGGQSSAIATQSAFESKISSTEIRRRLAQRG